MNIFELNILLIIIYAFIFLFVIRTRLSQLLFVIITTIQLIIINGLRGMGVGVDTGRYYRRFQDILESDWIGIFGTESGYNLTQKILSVFTDDFHIWLLIVAIFIFTALGIFIFKYSKRYFISYLLYFALGFFFFSLTGIRQSIAMIIVLYSYKYILDKNVFKFLITMIIAVSFHNTAIIFIPMYFLSRIKWSKLYLFILVAAYFFIYLFRLQIGELLTLLYYEGNSSVLNLYDSSGDIGGIAVMILLILLAGIFVYNPIRFKDNENIVLTNIILISFFIQSLSSFSYLFSRLNMYYLIFLIIYIPFLFDKIGHGTVKLKLKEARLVESFVKVVLIILLVIYYFQVLEAESPNILPFYFNWE